LKSVFPLVSLFGEPEWKNADYYLMHGPVNPSIPHAGRMRSLKNPGKLIMMEDGFFRSYTTFADIEASPAQRSSLSYVFDDLAFYFDGSRISRLEQRLNSDVSLTEAQLQRSRKIIDFIRDYKVSKYNHQPIFNPKFGKGKKVLVIDQSYNDASIIYSNAGTKTFDIMLSSAIKENPDAQIILKTHPDSKFKNNSYYSGNYDTENVIKMHDSINPWCLLEIVDHVYVCSSQIGFEALMAEKKVSVFGKPFYAGWGLTDDRIKISRRQRLRTLEELVYFTFIWYTHYFNPLTDNMCEVEDTLSYLVDQRDN
jgi:capsular polysaccharide export protein